MITVTKLNPLGERKIQYQGEVIQRLSHGVVIQAYWKQPAKDLGYTLFEPGDQFIEYYYTDHWFNIFDISSANGTHKGWYSISLNRRIFMMNRSSKSIYYSTCG